MNESGNSTNNHSSGMLKDYFDKVVRHYKNARLMWYILGILFVFAVVYTVTNFISIRKKIDEINARYQSEAPMPGNELPGVYRLRKESAFWQSRLAMAKNDSVCVTIDLVDSVVCLELQGVVLHSAPIRHIYKSDLFEALKPEAVLNLIAQPSTIINNESSFSKEPIKLKKAPKDTVEANLAVIQEAKEQQQQQQGGVENEALYYNLMLSNGLQVSFAEEQHNVRWKSIPMYIKKKIKSIEKNSIQLSKFKLPEYTPGILIEMTREDAASIYRGMPANASVVVRL
jgi:hypothetical protein